MADELRGPASGLREVLDRASDSMHVTRVFGEPIERDGALIIPVATVLGGGGGGGGVNARSQDSGEGGGFGVAARPTGVYVVKDGDAIWRPSVDLNRLVAWIGAIVVSLVFARSRVLKAQAKRGS